MSNRRVVIFNVPGEVRGQGRPRATVRGGFASVYDSPKDKANKHNIQLYAQESMKKRGYTTLANPDSKGISVELLVFVKTPSSMSKKKTEMAYRGEILPMRKPDLDNVMKAALDAMNSVVFKDDKDVTKAVVCRYYSDKPRLSVRVTWNEQEKN